MDNYKEVTQILLLEALKSAEMSMPETQSEEIETLQTACQEKDKQIADQAARLQKVEEIFHEYVKERDLELATKTGLLMSTVRGFSDMISEQAVLIQTLEEAFLKLYIDGLRVVNMPIDQAEVHAKEALEKLKQ